ncbi:LacI family DNA-binding transcriptional regulator [Phaeobacter sp. J2-8]|uniref:LacI family DNA-binding transcriptional regulator n=1 Tax=Phaeobacter sp. J2-8 TaxID=2931394 RepID=UPI001FD44FB4|nr:LacI family DNA-binding transcriptional regulator [Phaeobacter sp. J2-8]MCJ7873440.1 LacI family DNA-binding transcriptional regulator [Phaeobacter sp. J2-8]
MSKDSRPPTLKDVAAHCGVSVISASRAMSDAPNVSKALREKVERSARIIGYRRNRIAGSLRGQATDLITVIVPSMSNHVFPNIVDGIDDALQGSQLRLVLGMTKYDDANEEAILRDMLTWNPAGIILSGLEHSDTTKELLSHFAGPIVEVMDTDGDAIDMAVGNSMSEAGELIARHLVAKGYGRIAYVGAWGERPKRSAKRRVAFETELARLNNPLVTSVILEGESSLELGATGIKQLLDRDLNIDAVFFANDDLALGALFYCQANGIHVPEDIALAGFNGIEMCQSITPRLTTIATPRYQIGRLAGELLQKKVSRAEMPDKKTFQLDLELIEGSTT